MGKETASFISQLDAAWPLVGDPVNQGDDHLRLLKEVLQAQFPNLGALAANMTAVELNLLVGLTAAAAELNILDGVTATAADLNKTLVAAWEAGATADQTDAEIRTAVEAATDSNVFTDTDHTKLNGIEASATADQSDAEIRTAVEAASDSNVFTDADHSKLNAVEALADVTDTANVTAAGALMDSEVDADIKTLLLPASTTISAFIRTLLDDAAASNARTTLGVDAAGTDNSATHTGHVTGDTALTLVVAAITGQTLMGSALADGDELLISDGGVIKRSVFSRIYTYIAAKMVAAAHTWAGIQTFTAAIIANGELTLNAGYSEDADQYTIGSGTIDLDPSVATYFYPNADFITNTPTFTFGTPAASGRVSSFTMELLGADGATITWPTSVDWANGNVPVWTSGRDIVTFVTRDNGTTWYGFLGGLAFA